MLELNPLRPSPSPVMASEPYLDVLNLFTLMARTALAVLDYVIFAVKKAEEKNRRSQRLIAYKNRSAWKKSDTQRLKQLGASPIALRRLERAKSRSRPTVKQFYSLQDKIRSFMELQVLFDPNSSTKNRKNVFKKWPWYPHYVEALYRGETRLAREGRATGSPAEFAERHVAETLRISPSLVHAICQRVRNKQKDFLDEDDFPAITCAQYERWMTTGKSPRLDKD